MQSLSQGLHEHPLPADPCACRHAVECVYPLGVPDWGGVYTLPSKWMKTEIPLTLWTVHTSTCRAAPSPTRSPALVSFKYR